ncbi:2OG-Fe(II) oxygenase [Alteromonas aestuariivivens]|uniref:2OG-Fe(II) oxygenase n=1 Tax=Alteromonas aestuariivivens TaxID=1938339 RepID=A0A3D8M7M3_9ALTE|nr:2OG-Fe(II) oxygenase [Alteromonas aestuariivivens]RDV25537.1 2OG-Fe(II) oxygenase [Alteromonas aestuariivivens]
MPPPEHDFIEVIDNVLEPELCAKIIRAFNRSPNQQPGQTGGGVDLDKKRSSDISFSDNPEFAGLFAGVMQRTSAQLLRYMEKHHHALIGPIGLTVRHPHTGEAVKLTGDNFDEAGKPNMPKLMNYLFRIGRVNAQRYLARQGGYPYWHSEVYPQVGHNEALHRILLFMFYLNDVDEGGTTDFYYQNRSVQPKAGRMVIAPAYFTHTHRGQVPISHDKYILTSWLMFNRAEQIYTPKK